jgi:transposase
VIEMAARANSKPICAGCDRPGRVYDTLATRELKAKGLDPVLTHSRWCKRTMLSKIEPRKKVARMLRSHRELLLNWFRARGTISSSVMEGFNNRPKLTTRKSYGFRTFKAAEVALYHTLGPLPEPGLDPQVLLTRQTLLPGSL